MSNYVLLLVCFIAFTKYSVTYDVKLKSLTFQIAYDEHLSDLYIFFMIIERVSGSTVSKASPSTALPAAFKDCLLIFIIIIFTPGLPKTQHGVLGL